MKTSSVSSLGRLAARRPLALAMGLVAFAGAGAALLGQERADARPGAVPLAPAALTVAVTTPQMVTLPRSLAAQGSVSARDELVIGADANGVRLTTLLADTGDTVRRGQLLARGDDAQLRAQLAQQHALVRQAEVELAQAEANLERAERVQDSGIYSVEAVQTRRTAAQAAAAKLALAQAQRAELEVRLAHTTVHAPADGVIARRSASVGMVMQPGVELFRLIRDDELEWLAELPDHALLRIQAGAVARIRLDDGRELEGRVRKVAPTIDPRTRNGLVHVALPAGSPLRAGGHARGEIVVAQSPMLALPEGVVQVRDGQPFVFTVGADGVAQRTRIETGSRQRGLVEVTAGLAAEARVVATGAGFVKDGERVRVETPAASAATTTTSGGASS
jgi:HlyD family secretion protein